MEKYIDIKDYEGMYQISNHGNVRSLDRSVVCSNGHTVKYKAGNRKPSKSEYRMIALSKNGNVKMKKISRLVATHFIKQEDGKNIVNHIDGNKHNDNYKNLEWCNYSQNSVHASDTGLKKRVNKVSGVFFDKKRNKWCSYLYRNNKNIFLGRFETETKALVANSDALKKYNNENKYKAIINK